MMPTRDDDFDAENNNFSGINSNDGINNNLSSSSRLSQNPTGLSKAELRKVRHIKFKLNRENQIKFN